MTNDLILGEPCRFLDTWLTGRSCYETVWWGDILGVAWIVFFAGLIALAIVFLARKDLKIDHLGRWGGIISLAGIGLVVLLAVLLSKFSYSYGVTIGTTTERILSTGVGLVCIASYLGAILLTIASIQLKRRYLTIVSIILFIAGLLALPSLLYQIFGL